MKPRRTIFSFFALVAGSGLLYFEMVHRRAATRGETVFWVAIGGLLVLFALVDLFSKPTDPS